MLSPARKIEPGDIFEQDSLGLTRASFKPRDLPGARFAQPDDLPRLMQLHRGFQLEHFNRFTEAEEEMGKLAVFSGVREFPVRVKCATLAWHTLHSALENGEQVSTE